MSARDIFISYARSDGDRDVGLLADALRSRSISYWLDDSETQPGGSPADAISDGLSLATVVLFSLPRNTFKLRAGATLRRTPPRPGSLMTPSCKLCPSGGAP